MSLGKWKGLFVPCYPIVPTGSTFQGARPSQNAPGGSPAAGQKPRPYERERVRQRTSFQRGMSIVQQMRIFLFLAQRTLLRSSLATLRRSTTVIPRVSSDATSTSTKCSPALVQREGVERDRHGDGIGQRDADLSGLFTVSSHRRRVAFDGEAGERGVEGKNAVDIGEV